MSHALQATWPLMVSTQPGHDWPRLHARARRSSASFAMLLPVKKAGPEGRCVVVDRLGRADDGCFGACLRITLPEPSAEGVRWFDYDLGNSSELDRAWCDAVAVLFVGPASLRCADGEPADEQTQLRAALAEAVRDIPASAIARWGP